MLAPVVPTLPLPLLPRKKSHMKPCYSQLGSLFSRYLQLCWVLWCSQLGAAKYKKQASLQTNNRDLQCWAFWTCYLSYTQNHFHHLRGVVSTDNVNFWVTIFAMTLFCNLIRTIRSKHSLVSRPYPLTEKKKQSGWCMHTSKKQLHKSSTYKQIIEIRPTILINITYCNEYPRPRHH